MKKGASHIGPSLKDAFYAAVYMFCTRKYLGEKLASAMVVQDDWEIDEQMPRIRRMVKAHRDLKNDKNAEFALGCAVSHNCPEAVRLLLDAGVAPDNPDKDGSTNLTRTAISGYYDVAVMLIDKGAKIDTPDRWGKTPLMYAANNHPRLAELLLQHGASLHLRDRNGKTAVDLAMLPPEHSGLIEPHEKCRVLIVGAKEKEERETQEHETYLSDGMPATKPIKIFRPLSLLRR
ncbi:MAG: ankyrin repeat domain-containing protein [Alphaproteobacteria bacterium]|nr:MAG: ankyrin repeat domain-containing protein [Alphaproteobacteria bacterium]